MGDGCPHVGEGRVIRMDRTTYELLKAFGFSPFNAAEVALNAARGDEHALIWVSVAKGLAEIKPQKG